MPKYPAAEPPSEQLAKRRAPARRAHLTKRLVDSIQPGTADVIVWDTDVKGFHFKVTPNGQRSFLYYYKRGAVQRRPRIGGLGELTVEQARKIAKDWAESVRGGGDPSQDKRDERAELTFREAFEKYLEHAKSYCKASTHTENLRRLRVHIAPRLGRKQLSGVTTRDVQALHKAMATPGTIVVQRDTRKDGKAGGRYEIKTGGPIAANRVLSLIHAFYEWCIQSGLVPAGFNPARGLAHFKEQTREKYLDPGELAALVQALDACEAEQTVTPSAAGVIRLLLFSGMRRGEVIGLRWHEVDLDGRVLDLDDSKTGKKRVVLNNQAVEVIRQQLATRPDDNEFVFPGHVKGRGLVNLSKPWGRVLKRAGIGAMRLHDLRHGFASAAVWSNLSLHTTGGLLGHRSNVTKRYAHLKDDVLRAAADQVGAHLDAMIKAGAKVVELDAKPAEAEAGKEDAGTS